MLIPHHLLRPKTLPPAHISRKRLIALFNHHAFAKVVMVEALAGYGKSVAVAEYVQHLSAHVAWYPLELLDQKEPFSFLWNFVRAIQTALPQFGQDIALLFEKRLFGKQLQSEDLLFTTILPSLVHEMAQLEHPLWIVLENYHTLGQQEINEIMEYLIDRLPGYVHLIVTARLSPRWPARPRWESQGTLATISSESLAFTKSESEDMALAVGAHLMRDQLDTIYTAIGGWPILHHLLYQNCRGKRAEEINGMLHLLNRPDHAIGQYLTAELLQQESIPIRDFLCRTSLLRRLDPDLCNKLLESHEASQILEYLTQGAFLSIVVEPEYIHFAHSHEIIREFLREILLKDYGRQEVDRLNSRLGKIFEQQESWDQAIHYYSQGQQFIEVTRLIINRGGHLLNTDQLPRLATWISHVPREWLEKNPTLLVYQGIILGNQKNVLAEECFLQAQQLFRVQGDIQSAIWASGELGWFYILTDRHTRAISTLETAWREPTIPPQLQAKLLHYLSMAFNGLDRYDEALQRGEQAAEMLRQLNTSEDKVSLTRLLRHMSHIYHYLGRSQAAVRTLEEARELTQMLDLGDWALIWINNQLAEIYRHLGNFEGAHHCLDVADSLLDRYQQIGSQHRLLKFVVITRGHLYREAYNYQEAEALYRKAGRGHPNGVMLALRLVQPQYAQEALELATEKWREEQHGESSVVRAAYQGMLGLAYINTKNYEQAQIHLETAEKVLEQKRAIYYLITVRMYLAKVYFVQGKNAKGMGCLDYALTQMAAEGYYSLDWWQPSILAEMCSRALLEGIELDFVESLVIKRLMVDHVRSFLPLVNHQQNNLRERVIHILDHLGMTTGLEVRQSLNSCKEKMTQERILSWLNAGWLTEVGIIGIRQRLLHFTAIRVCAHVQRS